MRDTYFTKKATALKKRKLSFARKKKNPKLVYTEFSIRHSFSQIRNFPNKKFSEHQQSPRNEKAANRGKRIQLDAMVIFELQPVSTSHLRNSRLSKREPEILARKKKKKKDSDAEMLGSV